MIKAVYFDADGTPMLHCRIYSLAGASWYEYLIPLFPLISLLPA